MQRTTDQDSPVKPSSRERVLATYRGLDQPLLFSGDTLGVTVAIPPDTKPDPPPPHRTSPSHQPSSAIRFFHPFPAASHRSLA
jgi:hypothetical protein